MKSPRIKRVMKIGKWVCEGDGIPGVGDTPIQAYERWLAFWRVVNDGV